MRIVLAEDGALLREGLASLLQRFGHEVVACVEDAEAAVVAVNRHRPDMLVTDVRMPPNHADDGLRAAVRLRRRHRGLGVLALSQYVAEDYATTLLNTGDEGGVGYLLKERVGDVAEFLDAVTRIGQGGTVVDPEVVRQLLGEPGDPVRRLTPREREVLEHMAQGRSNLAISQRLFVTEAAVSKHIANILTKLGLGPNDQHNRRVLAVLTYLRR
ncbi:MULTISPECIES: response regulator transcription factor [Actinoalloteichus]|uniref:response regulator transcription factor n=1 Tax=Actinoalloteichus TaxID=65496 RepID=UPI0004AAAB5B|nr:response regulator transcription factor [Actinoalloteichus caeruleus]